MRLTRVEQYRAGMMVRAILVSNDKDPATRERLLDYQRKRAEHEEQRELRRCGENPDDYTLLWDGPRSMEGWEDEEGEWHRLPLDEAEVIGDIARVLPKSLAARFRVVTV